MLAQRRQRPERFRASTWTAIIIPSSRSPAGRAPPIPAYPAPHNLRLLDYAITVNVDPLPITQEINKEKRT